MKLTSAHPTDRRGPGFLVMDLVVARNCCMARMLPGEAELVSECCTKKCTAL